MLNSNKLILSSVLMAVCLTASGVAQEMPGKHFARLATVSVADSEKMNEAVREWIAFTRKHAPGSAAWDCYVDTGGRLHRFSFMKNYAALHDQQKHEAKVLEKHHRLGLPNLSARWNEASNGKSVSLWKFLPELSYANGRLDAENESYRKLYLVHVKRDRVNDWIEAAKLMNQIDEELGHDYHRYIYECQVGESLPLYAVVVPDENQLSYLEAFQSRAERRESSSLNAKVQALFQDAARRIDELHLTHRPDLSYNPE